MQYGLFFIFLPLLWAAGFIGLFCFESDCISAKVKNKVTYILIGTKIVSINHLLAFGAKVFFHNYPACGLEPHDHFLESNVSYYSEFYIFS